MSDSEKIKKEESCKNGSCEKSQCKISMCSPYGILKIAALAAIVVFAVIYFMK